MINTKTLSEQTYSELYRMIMNHEFSPDEKITEEKIANLLGVSRTTVKKAFTTLVKEGVLEDIPRRGVFLKTYSKEEIGKICDLREITAGLSARYAALNMTRRDLNFLESVYKKMELALKNHDNAAYIQCDLELHEAIVKFSGSAILSDIISNFNLRLNPFNIVGSRNSEETIMEHRNIIDSLERGNPEDAENIMRKHLSKGKEILVYHIPVVAR
ncbi:MAG: GntR family transcriptional regulator [Spirochaetales bacterium]|nr:GntR family transcriptional regulator [Spirochaetales bacterium]